MNFNLKNSIEVLQRTPLTLEQMLSGISEPWILSNEGPDTWSPYDVLGHLIHGENTDWIARLEIILSDGPNKTFASFDRFAQFTECTGKTMADLLQEFKQVRQDNIKILQSKNLSAADLAKTGIHPKFGQVTLAQLLSTWVAHDLDHIFQIARVMAKRYTADVGPWIEYLRILKQ